VVYFFEEDVGRAFVDERAFRVNLFVRVFVAVFCENLNDGAPVCWVQLSDHVDTKVLTITAVVA